MFSQKTACLRSDQIFKTSSVLHLLAGWKYHGTLVEAGNTDNGTLWEYPVLAKLPQAKTDENGRILFEYGDQEVGVSSTADKDHVFLTGQFIIVP